ncbi:branched-chain amino acid aminotransferase [Anopheles sinensis]|uniref:Branched-chain amino acid aminotransferase n=1 Tax=Anopheles sinensis TaxID=74873 RepID=A0A084VY08_ANOSI|nr:branched-chain amino acid aminotransferase [Anopheles sinensis]
MNREIIDSSLVVASGKLCSSAADGGLENEAFGGQSAALCMVSLRQLHAFHLKKAVHESRTGANGGDFADPRGVERENRLLGSGRCVKQTALEETEEKKLSTETALEPAGWTGATSKPVAWLINPSDVDRQSSVSVCCRKNIKTDGNDDDDDDALT